MSWNLNGNWLASAGRDQAVCVWDVRHTKRELANWKGHTRDILALAWHPIHQELLASGVCVCVLMMTTMTAWWHGQLSHPTQELYRPSPPPPRVSLSQVLAPTTARFCSGWSASRQQWPG